MKLSISIRIKSTKIARSVTGEKIKFLGELFTNATFNGKIFKLKSFLLKNTNNLFGTDDTIPALGHASKLLLLKN